VARVSVTLAAVTTTKPEPKGGAIATVGPIGLCANPVVNENQVLASPPPPAQSQQEQQEPGEEGAEEEASSDRLDDRR
jgi:hypothetical protein